MKLLSPHPTAGTERESTHILSTNALPQLPEKLFDTKGQQQEKEFGRIETRPTLLLVLVTHVGTNTLWAQGFIQHPEKTPLNPIITPLTPQ